MRYIILQKWKEQNKNNKNNFSKMKNVFCVFFQYKDGHKS